MDPARFAEVLRSVTAASSRRDVLRVLSGGAFAGVGVQERGAAKKPLRREKKGDKPKGCKRGQKRCGTTCIAASACCTSRECVYCAGEVCQPDGACRCNAGTTQFNGVCGFKPDCLPVPDNTGNGPAKCCSSNAQYEVDSDTWTCLPGKDQCLSDADCERGPCRGYMCPERYHAVTECNF